MKCIVFLIICDEFIACFSISCLWHYSLLLHQSQCNTLDIMLIELNRKIVNVKWYMVSISYEFIWKILWCLTDILSYLYCNISLNNITKNVREILKRSYLRFPIDISLMAWLLQYCDLWKTLMSKVLCTACSGNVKYNPWYVLGVWNRWFVSSSVINSSLFCAGCWHSPSNSLSTDPMLYRLAGFVNSSCRETSGSVHFIIQQLAS